MGFEALIAAYEKWIKTPEGKKRNEEVNARKLTEIPKEQLPEGWTIEDGDKEGSYFVYTNSDCSFTITIELGLTGPIQFNGQQSIDIKVKEETPSILLEEDEDDENEETSEDTLSDGRVVWTRTAEKDFEKNAKEANEKVIELMRRYS